MACELGCRRRWGGVSCAALQAFLPDGNGFGRREFKGAVSGAHRWIPNLLPLPPAL